MNYTYNEATVDTEIDRYEGMIRNHPSSWLVPNWEAILKNMYSDRRKLKFQLGRNYGKGC